MAEHGYDGGAGEWAVVRRPGVVRLTETALHLRGETALARRRGATMTELARTFSAERVNANVSVIEPDGAAWSMSVTPGGAFGGGAPDGGGKHGTRTLT
jgi:hypothetical protein